MADLNNGLLIGCALDRESAALEHRLPRLAPVLSTGMGAERTRATLESVFRRASPHLFIFTGTAGQLDPSAVLGEVILPGEWCREGGPCVSIAADLARLLAAQWSPRGRGLTVVAPVLTPRSRLQLHRRWGARICDMEAAVALETARRHGIPCLAPKVVSDTAESGVEGFLRGFEDHMDSLARYLEGLLAYLDPERRAPTRVPGRE